MGNNRSTPLRRNKPYPLPTPEQMIWRLCLKVMQQDMLNNEHDWIVEKVSALTGIEEDVIWRVYKPRQKEYFRDEKTCFCLCYFLSRKIRGLSHFD